jgi:hypothetical protein
LRTLFAREDFVERRSFDRRRCVASDPLTCALMAGSGLASNQAPLGSTPQHVLRLGLTANPLG